LQPGETHEDHRLFIADGESSNDRKNALNQGDPIVVNAIDGLFGPPTNGIVLE
jgi:hypothetical protein